MTTSTTHWFLLASLLVSCAGLHADPSGYSFENAQEFLNTYCLSCHQGDSPAGGFQTQRLSTRESLRLDAGNWSKLVLRLQNGEMPPKGFPAPEMDQRERFTAWAEVAVRSEVCAAGVTTGRYPIRRLNRDEYSATLRDLFDMHLDLGRMLPADGAGGEGFDNAAETLFLSPLHSEKYIETATFAINFAAKEFKSRDKIFVARPGPGVSPDQAAREILKAFLPRAFRRPVDRKELEPYVKLFRKARKQGEDFESSILFSLRSALVSPMFLFHVTTPHESSGPQPLDSYALASRLSYFLWGSMPDELLFDIAVAGKLHDPEVMKQVIGVMLRNDRSLVFAERFVGQWLRTRELDTDKQPDAELFPVYAQDEELRSDIRLQPVLFFRELLVQDLSLLNLLDSKHTIGTRTLAKHFGVDLPVRQNAAKQPQWVELPEGSGRGGVLGMPAILAVSSYPYRTSPVLRGAWILDSILGTPPPPPPPDVPALEKAHEGEAPKSMREILSQHRADAACAGCHSRIDPLGFALENYDVIGRWRDEDGGKPVDNSGELVDGTSFHGPDELKTALLERKDQFIRNLTSKMLGYALGRGLTLEDSCTVDAIVARLRESDYRARTLIEEIALSMPFRFQAGSETRE